MVTKIELLLIAIDRNLDFYVTNPNMYNKYMHWNNKCQNIINEIPLLIYP